MKRNFYIAYGSNMSIPQMAERCPDAKVLGKALLRGFRLVFRTHATIEYYPGDCVQAIVWEISEADEHRLDFYEGFPDYYDKKPIYVSAISLDGTKEYSVNAMVYIMNDGHSIAAPSRVYYKGIADAYKHFGFELSPLHRALCEACDA